MEVKIYNIFSQVVKIAQVLASPTSRNIPRQFRAAGNNNLVS